MNKNIYKVLIILICFAFVLVVAFASPENEEAGTGIDMAILQEVDDDNAEMEAEEPEKIELVNNPELRILITTDGFAGSVHEEVRVTSPDDFKIIGEDGTLFGEYGAWEEINLDIFKLKEGETLIFESEEKMSVPSLKRAQGVPEYYGKLQIYKEEDGYSIINVVPMEKYLLSVVPSEMPSTYPLEALKAQAICARSYAYHYVINESGLPHGANMNDSTDYQVYNNIKETEATNSAVAETEGMILTRNGLPLSTYFFSTSCGYTTNETIWKDYFGGMELEDDEVPEIVYQAGRVSETQAVTFPAAVVAESEAVAVMSLGSGDVVSYTAAELAEEENFYNYITSEADGFLESEEQWYRWSYTGKITSDNIEQRLIDRYAVRPDLILTLDDESESYVNRDIDSVGKITNIDIIKRLEGGVADELLIETTKDTYLVIGEYNIRYVLSDGESKVIRNDGSAVTVSSLLPSAYFVTELKISNGVVHKITLTGGGYGHGVGMSQNGAKQAAMQGMNCEEIIEMFYADLELIDLK